MDIDIVEKERGGGSNMAYHGIITTGEGLGLDPD